MPTQPNTSRRVFLWVAASSASVAGVGYLWEKTHDAHFPHGPPLAVSIGALPEGKLLVVEWASRPVWVLRRSPQDLANLALHEATLTDPHSERSLQPPTCRNRNRAIRPDVFVAIGLCTHQGCAPALEIGKGFVCPCHASSYDLAGRVFNGGPALANLVIPAHHFSDENSLVVGEA